MTTASNLSLLVPLYRSLIVSTLIAVIAILCYFALPESKERILPNMVEKSHLFFDAESGGKTTAEWIDQRQLSFKCIGGINADANKTMYCGVSINLINASDEKDYSKYSRMELKVNYKGGNRLLRLRMHNFNAATPKDNYRETLKGLDVSFMVEEARDVLSIHNYGWVASEDSKSSQNVIDIGLDLVPPIAAGEHQLTLEYVDIYGELLPAASWYLGVALTWLLANLLFIARHLLVQERRIRNDSKRLSSLTNFSDDLQQESERYKKLSNVDTLTGALNRNGFAAEINKLAPDGKLIHNNTMMVIDLDHFKKVNDTYGHDAGDAVLRETAKVIQTNTRATDLFVRWGGEEFLLFCADINAQHALLIAEKIRNAVETTKITYHDKHIPVTVSIGVGVIQREENFDELFHRADQALYSAKHLGRNCVVLSETDAKP
ncbi:MAG: GGDEF domain-containing protein [Cellvibrio sp.]